MTRDTMELAAKLPDDDELCPGCEACPAEGEWTCPVCDAEWFDFCPDEELSATLSAAALKARAMGDG